MRLTERVALITGDGEELTRVCALALAREGARVVVAEPHGTRGEAIAAEVRALGGDATSIGTDMADEASIRALLRETLARYGRLDILVNTPAPPVSRDRHPFDEISAAEWDAQLAANVRGTFLCCKAAAATLRAQRAGKIINLVSTAFDLGEPNQLHHVAAMGALIGLTRGIASELGAFGVNVNALAHSPIPALRPVQGSRPPGQALGHAPTLDDLRGTLLFLASPDSDFMTGQTLRVDGGLRYY